MIASNLARPPIQPDECEHADIAICRHHKGLVRFSTEEREGTVYFCPIGKQFWRYTQQQNSFTTPLPYRPSGVI